MYQLKKPLQVKYLWNKGPTPSGYAEVTLSLQPQSSGLKSLSVIMPSDEIVRVRLTEHAKKKPLLASERKIFLEMAMRGIEKGAKEALIGYLEEPVINLDIIAEQIEIDLVYSTEMAFRIASRLAVQKLLAQAEEEGLLYSSFSEK